jgi:uroporphyrinogen decarboxylase
MWWPCWKKPNSPGAIPWAGEMAPLTPRERVLCALNHEEPDRVPIMFGGSGATSMLAPAYDRLKAYLGVHSETRVSSRLFQYTLLDEEVMVRFGSDFRPLVPGPAVSMLARELPDDAVIDDWGTLWQRRPGVEYYEMMRWPLQNATLETVLGYPWPDLAHPSRFTGLKARAQAIHAAGYASIVLAGLASYEICHQLLGLEAWLTQLAARPDGAHALMRLVTDRACAMAARLMEAAGDDIDVVVMADDLGGQNAPLISPQMYRALIKPYQAEIIATLKRRHPVKVFYHSCGSIYPLINDFIEIGVDLLNPVQVSAQHMGDTARLKKEFGPRLTFCGGVDTQHVLPHGTPDDVRREVRRRINDLGPGGGYVLAAVHAIQPDVPPENVCALFEEGLAAGRYPLVA